MPGNLLDYDTALRLAGELTIIDKFPWNAGAVSALAKYLISVCTGSFLDNCLWTPERQAEWTVSTAVAEMEEWSLKEFRELFERKFRPKTLPPERQVRDLGPKPVIQCMICEDKGYYGLPPDIRYCDCESGLISAQVDGKKMLDWLNQSIPKAAPAPKPPPSNRLKPVTQEDIDRLLKEREKPQ